MDQYRNTIREKISSLNDSERIAFSLIITEKLLPNYIYFSNNYGYGDSSTLSSIIATLYENLIENTKDDNIDDYIDTVDSITPNTEDFGTVYCSFALDACTSLLSTLYYLKDNNLEDIVDVAIYARDTIDMYIQERDDLNINNSELERLIDQDPFMKNEKKRQDDVIKYLSNVESVNQKELEILRNIGNHNIIDLDLLQPRRS